VPEGGSDLLLSETGKEVEATDGTNETNTANVQMLECSSQEINQNGEIQATDNVT
jgi:hypothetical protein